MRNAEEESAEKHTTKVLARRRTLNSTQTSDSSVDLRTQRGNEEIIINYWKKDQWTRGRNVAAKCRKTLMYKQGMFFSRRKLVRIFALLTVLTVDVVVSTIF